MYRLTSLASTARDIARRRTRAQLVVPIVLVAAGSSCMAATGAFAAIAHSSSGNIVLTEADYYNAPPAVTALPPLLKKCGAANGVTINRQLIPQANLVPKLLQDVSTHSFPNLALIDNPNVQQFAATGALQPLTGIDTTGIVPSIASAGTYKGKIYGIAPGVNDLALYYNKSLLAAAHLAPPTTWAQLKSDASALTQGTTYGFGFSAPNEEEATWNFEPLFWSNGASLLHLNGAPAVQALTFYQSLVTDGSVPKDVVSWTQADVEEQFAAGHLAMMTNGPWQLPVLDKVSGLEFGIVPFPTPTSAGKPISPLGGEMWTIGRSTSTKEEKALAVVQCMVAAKQSLVWSKTVGYISTTESVAKQMAKSNPQLAAFAAEIPTAQARTGAPAMLGPKYNTVSQAVWTAIQAVLTGQATPQAALNTAQQQAFSG